MMLRAGNLMMPLAITLLLSAVATAAAAESFSTERANSYASAGDWSALLRYSVAWTKAEPDAPMAWYYLGNTYGRAMQQPSQALPAFERAVKLRPKWPEAWNALGFVNVELKRYDEAAKAFTQAVDQAPAKAQYWNSLAATYSFQNRLSLTLKTLEDEQRAITGSRVFVDWYNLGNGFCTMEEFGLAAGAYRRAAELNPSYGPIWNNLGSVEGAVGNTQAALADYRRAAVLGDQLGASNYTRMLNAIAAARQAKNANNDPLVQLQHALAADEARRAQQAWQDRLGRAQN